jgi:hypothetical protein
LVSAVEMIRAASASPSARVIAAIFSCIALCTMYLVGPSRRDGGASRIPRLGNDEG